MTGGPIQLVCVFVALSAGVIGCSPAADTTGTQTSVAEHVAIAAPRDEASFMVGDDITIEISAQTKEPVQRLELWSNGGVIRTFERPPFRTTIRKAGPGGYRMHAVAHTASGKIASPEIRISVLMSEEDRMRELTAEEAAALIGGPEPRIFFDTPTPGTTLRAPADITIEGWAVFPAAAMKRITVLGDGKPLATFTTSRFKHVWRGIGPGKHVVAIQAVDAGGRTTTMSETVTVKK